MTWFEGGSCSVIADGGDSKHGFGFVACYS
jgi:hypothetical protein